MRAPFLIAEPSAGGAGYSQSPVGFGGQLPAADRLSVAGGQTATARACC